jgi:hypothetical protein
MQFQVTPGKMDKVETKMACFEDRRLASKKLWRQWPKKPQRFDTHARGGNDLGRRRR